MKNSLLVVALLIFTFSGTAHGRFEQSQCNLDSDCVKYGKDYKCQPQKYSCGASCTAVKLMCFKQILKKSEDDMTKTSDSENTD